MTIAKALKEKNKQVALVKDINSKINLHNCIPSGDRREYDIAALINESVVESRKLAELKAKIHAASQPVREKIFLLSELKSQVSFLKKVPTKNGTERSGYRSEPITLSSQVSSVEMENIVKSLEKEIDGLQEELDKFNHETTI